MMDKVQKHNSFNSYRFLFSPILDHSTWFI